MVRVNGIGIWFKILENVSYFSVLTNASYKNRKIKIKIIQFLLGFNNSIFIRRNR